MDWLHAIVLGLIQGVTEFFPVSSSAHLRFFKNLFGTEEAVLFDLFCHLGTMVALVYYFRKDIMALLMHPKKMVPFAVAMVPLVPFYGLLKPVREFISKPEYLGFCMMGTAVLLYAASKLKIKIKPQVGIKDALWIGAFQGVALIPGISRSAATIGAGIWRGLGPLEAVRFSFLLSLPAVGGGTVLELWKAKSTAISWPHCLIGFAAAGIMGFATVRYAIPLLQRGVLKPFALYCLIAGILVTVYIYG